MAVARSAFTIQRASSEEYPGLQTTGLIEHFLPEICVVSTKLALITGV